MTIRTIGSDVEVFLFNGNEVESAVGRIGGSKEEPLLVQNGNLQEDNILAEFAIDPVSSKQEFVNSLKGVMSTLKDRMNPLDIKVIPSAYAKDSILNNPKAMEFGCEADYDAWSMEMNDSPDPFMVGNLRTAGGHVHIGYESDMDMFNLVRWLDFYLGVPSVILDPDKDRRNVYGKAGSFRPKSYGIEYRVLSNFWIQDDSLIEWVYDQVFIAYEAAEREISSTLGVEMCERVIDTINNSNEKVASDIVNEFGLFLPEYKGVANG